MFIVPNYLTSGYILVVANKACYLTLTGTQINTRPDLEVKLARINKHRRWILQVTQK